MICKCRRESDRPHSLVVDQSLGAVLSNAELFTYQPSVVTQAQLFVDCSSVLQLTEKILMYFYIGGVVCVRSIRMFSLIQGIPMEQALWWVIFPQKKDMAKITSL